MAEASTHKREDSTSLVLSFGEIEYKPSILSPLVIDVDSLVASREQNSVNLTQHSFEISLGTLVVYGNNLCS